MRSARPPARCAIGISSPAAAAPQTAATLSATDAAAGKWNVSPEPVSSEKATAGAASAWVVTTSAIARFEWAASLPPRRITAFPERMQSPPASAVTFGRLS